MMNFLNSLVDIYRRAFTKLFQKGISILKKCRNPISFTITLVFCILAMFIAPIIMIAQTLATLAVVWKENK
jgi:hypothetical protein